MQLLTGVLLHISIQKITNTFGTPEYGSSPPQNKCFQATTVLPKILICLHFRTNRKSINIWLNNIVMIIQLTLIGKEKVDSWFHPFFSVAHSSLISGWCSRANSIKYPGNPQMKGRASQPTTLEHW